MSAADAAGADIRLRRYHDAEAGAVRVLRLPHAGGAASFSARDIVFHDHVGLGIQDAAAARAVLEAAGGSLLSQAEDSA